MLTIGKLTPGRAFYYVEQLPGGADEYYTGSEREEPGVWLGTAAETLGLDGRVRADDFRAVLDARHPATGELLGVPRTTAGRLAGFDLCFSAPKSVSVAWALGTPEVADAIAAAHDRAVARAVDALEAEVVRARRGAGGQRLIETEGIVAAAFGHRTSRAGDPQIHTHVVVANMTPDAAGRWTALDGGRVYRWAKTLGYLYQAELRAELTQTLGVRWGPMRNGAADLADIDTVALDAFSKRTAEIERATGGAVDLPLAVAKAVTLSTRGPKQAIPDLEVLRDRWHTEAAEIGLQPDDIGGLLRGVRSNPRVATPELLPKLLRPQGLTCNASSFDRRDVLQALCAAHPAGAHIIDLRDRANQVLEHPDVVALSTDRPAGPRYTTAELLDIESRLLTRAGAPSRPLAVAGVEHITRALCERPSLSDEHRHMISSLTRSGAPVEVVIGRAGAGKTFALDAARAAWQASGHTVIGAALAARAAAELQAGTGIPSDTVDRLLDQLDRPGPLSGLAPNTVLVVDEAGMIGTRKLARLLDHAQHYQAKVVLAGDHRQLPEINAGGAFAALAHTVPTVELQHNHRQIHAWERDALAELRSGSVPQGFAAYHQAGRVTLAGGADQARQAMVADWWAAGQDGQNAVMYALRRADVDDLNRRARALLDGAGRLGLDRLAVAGREFAAGDRVLCLRNDRRLGVRNGTVATITAIHPESGEVTLDHRTRLPHRYLAGGHLGHAYAMTIHKAQGATVDRAFVLGSEGLYREAGYVGLSRARHATRLYIVAPTPGRHAVVEVDPVVETIRRLGQSRAQQLAVEQLNTHKALDPSQHSPERTALLADPAPWLVDAIGPPPLSGPDRDRWAHTAERIAAYRDVHNIADKTNALGPQPQTLDQRRAWELARLSIDQFQRSIELDQGLHL